MSRGDDRQQSYSAKMRREGSPVISPSCRSFFNDQSEGSSVLAYALGRGRNSVMRTITRTILAACCVGAVAIETLTPVYAQYYPPPPGYGYGYGYQTYNGCPPGYTVQGGNCAPYRGPVGPGYGYGYGHRTYNGCPPGYTVQGGNCAPYQGPVGPGYGYYRR